MGKFTFKKALLIIALAIMPMSLFAQNDDNVQKPKNDNHWFIDIDAGGALTFGDNNPFQFKETKFNTHLGFGYAFARHFSVYAKLGGGFLSAHKDGLFDTKYQHFINYNANFSFDIVSAIGGFRPDRVFGLKLHVGIGQVQFRSKAVGDNGKIYTYGYKTSSDKTHSNGIDGRKLILEVPMGLEFNFNVSKLIDIYADLGMTFTDTDALEGFQSGKNKDWYGTGNVGIRFKFGRAKHVEPAPVVEEPVVVKEPEPVKEEVVKEPEPVREEVVAAPVVRERVYTDSRIEIIYFVGTANINKEASHQSIENFKNNVKDLDVSKIIIVGYASPEGKPELNDQLALDRANAAKDYIVSELKTHPDEIEFEVRSAGADWDGFMEALRNSNISEKEAIANKINESENKAGTLWIMADKHPEIKALYPALRRADVTVTVVTE